MEISLSIIVIYVLSVIFSALVFYQDIKERLNAEKLIIESKYNNRIYNPITNAHIIGAILLALCPFINTALTIAIVVIAFCFIHDIFDKPFNKNLKKVDGNFYLPLSNKEEDDE